jgi:hypothetical protein
LHNLEDCYLPISNGLASHAKVFSVVAEPSEKQVCHADEVVDPSLDPLLGPTLAALLSPTCPSTSPLLDPSCPLLGPLLCIFRSFVGSFQLTSLATQIVEDCALATPDLNTSTHQGLIMEAKGIIQGYDNTYYIINPLQGGRQTACYLVSMEKDGEDCYFAAKVRIFVLYLVLNFVRTRSGLLVPMHVKR